MKANMEWLDEIESYLSSNVIPVKAEGYLRKLVAVVRLTECELTRTSFIRLPYDAARKMQDLRACLRLGKV